MPRPISDRRVQYLVAGSTVAASSDLSVFEDDDEEAARPHFRFDENDDASESILGASGETRPQEDSFITQIDWDEDYETPQPVTQRPQATRSDTITQVTHERGRPLIDPDVTLPPIIGRPSEQTPLLKKMVSFSTLVHPQRANEASAPAKGSPSLSPEVASYHPEGISRRRLSSGSAVSARHYRGGQSTYGQTVRPTSILYFIGKLGKPLIFSKLAF